MMDMIRRGGVRAYPLLGLLLLSACAPSSQVTTPQVITVFATSATYPWLSEVYGCAPSSAAVKVSDPDTSELSLRLGEPTSLTLPAYQIGTDDVLVVVHPQVGVGALTPDQTRQIFGGQIANWKEVGGADLAVQVWAFSAHEDIQVLFDRLVMHGQPVTSLARLAVSSQIMSDSVGSVLGSVGVLARRWKTGNTRQAMLVGSAPVLAIAGSEPKGDVGQLLHCLQSGH